MAHVLTCEPVVLQEMSSSVIVDALGFSLSVGLQLRKTGLALCCQLVFSVFLVSNVSTHVDVQD